jgi:hypothetical protein
MPEAASGGKAQKTLHLCEDGDRIRKQVFTAQHEQLLPPIEMQHLLDLLGVEPAPLVVVGLALARSLGAHQGLGGSALLHTALHLMVVVDVCGDGINKLATLAVTNFAVYDNLFGT